MAHLNKKLYLALLVGISLLFNANNAYAITITPVRFEISTDPGNTVSGEMVVMNEQDEPKTLYSSYENFEARGENGTPTFVPAAEGLATWMTTEPSITLAPKESKVVPFSITVPQGAEAGGHFAAIFWSSNPSEPGQVSIGAKIGTLVLLTVSGEITEEGKVMDFTTKDNQKKFDSLPVGFTYRFQNGGNDRIKPEGLLVVKNMFGMTTKNLPANQVEGNVLPRSIRKFEVVWQSDSSDGMSLSDKEKIENETLMQTLKRQWNNFALGKYTAYLDISYGVKNQKANASYSFFVFPWQLLLTLFVIIIILIFIFRNLVRKYNNWVIENARQSLAGTQITDKNRN